MGFAGSNLAETLGFACIGTGSRPKEVLGWTQTEREVAAYSSAAVFSWCLEQYADMWDG